MFINMWRKMAEYETFILCHSTHPGRVWRPCYRAMASKLIIFISIISVLFNNALKPNKIDPKWVKNASLFRMAMQKCELMHTCCQQQ